MANPKILERLRKARTELNQSELAEKLGMSTSTYKRMVDGAAPFTMDTIQKASKIFSVSEDVILGRVKSFELQEPEITYASDQDRDTVVMIKLDGSKSTLDNAIKKLTAINKSIYELA
jgi:transcriptional regulator with XRE-family HTH domain